ncbi:ATP-binding protein [Candidatus Regiella insecticola]|uniref:ATP-binding protein n=1 Tax=Candidatus Regiella insecticola TaxID=138073 RepID=UPI002A4E1219|nr:ATP-binding protein [Candidatus Regiella insecticola]
MSILCFLPPYFESIYTLLALHPGDTSPCPDGLPIRGNRYYQELSFEERLSLLLDQEISLRDKRKIERLTRQARFRLKAELANVDYSASHQLDAH